MTRTALLATTSLALLLCGCSKDHQAADGKPADDAAAKTAQSAPSPATATQTAPAASMPEELSEEDIVWADEAFLAGAGVKEGQDVIYLPTPPMVVDKMVELAQIKPTDLVYDLGTGDGRIAIGAAKACGCKVVGYEIDAELVAQARENVRAAGLEELVTIEQQDILELDFSAADVVLMYLNPDINVRLIPQLQKLKPGSRVVSHDWGMNGKLENEFVVENFVSKVPDFVNLHTLYKWEAPITLKN